MTLPRPAQWSFRFLCIKYFNSNVYCCTASSLNRFRSAKHGDRDRSRARLGDALGENGNADQIESGDAVEYLKGHWFTEPILIGEFCFRLGGHSLGDGNPADDARCQDGGFGFGRVRVYLRQ